MRNLSDTIARLKRLPHGLPQTAPASTRLRAFNETRPEPRAVEGLNLCNRKAPRWVRRLWSSFMGAPRMLPATTRAPAGHVSQTSTVSWSSIQSSSGRTIRTFALTGSQRTMPLEGRARPGRSARWLPRCTLDTVRTLSACSLPVFPPAVPWRRLCSPPTRTCSLAAP